MISVLLMSLNLLSQEAPAPSAGPMAGSLVIDGGGQNDESMRRFVTLAGGPGAHFVVIPTADEADPADLENTANGFAKELGVERVTILHTRDRTKADSAEFVAPLQTANAVWFGGGRQWRLVDAYLGTRTQREIEAVLARGGVIGGSSAGATIQGSYLLRGAPEGNTIMMAKGHEEGFGYLKNVAIDQHLVVRGRQEDILPVIDKHPHLLGIGLDEPAGIVVHGDRFEVVGAGVVGIYDGKDHDGKPYYFLGPGEGFDLRTRRRASPAPVRAAISKARATKTSAAAKASPLDSKSTIDSWVIAHAGDSWQMAKKIWTWAEVGYHEQNSAKLLADTMEAGGFRVERGIANIPTAFTATIGSGKPVIAILGEYDALPGLSQEAVPTRQARAGSTAGHGCGHHLFGVASATASLAIGEQIKTGKLKGTLRFYGCPAEEGGSAKAFMVRDHLFDDCDAALHWHPASQNTAGDESSQARIAAKFRFHGTSSHAAAAPEKGRSALDAVALTNHAAELLREHTPDFTRIHHIVTAGGTAPNIVPDFAETFFYIRHPTADVVQTLYPRLLKCAQASALATETRLETEYLGGILEIVPNDTIGSITRANLTRLNDLNYDETETRFATEIRQTLPPPLPPLESITRISERKGQSGTGSTDVGDVSWVVPTGGFTTACWVPGTSPHCWQAVAAGGTSIGRKGMVLAARVLAASAFELFQSPQALHTARAEHTQRLAGRPYRSLLGPDQKPPLDYRDTPSAKPR